MGPTMPSSEALYDFAASTAYDSLKGTAAVATAMVLNHQLGHRYQAALNSWFGGTAASSKELEEIKRSNQSLVKALAPMGLLWSAGFFAVVGATAYVGQQILFSE